MVLESLLLEKGRMKKSLLPEIYCWMMPEILLLGFLLWMMKGKMLDYKRVSCWRREKEVKKNRLKWDVCNVDYRKRGGPCDACGSCSWRILGLKLRKIFKCDVWNVDKEGAFRRMWYMFMKEFGTQMWPLQFGLHLKRGPSGTWKIPSNVTFAMWSTDEDGA